MDSLLSSQENFMNSLLDRHNLLFKDNPSTETHQKDERIFAPYSLDKGQIGCANQTSSENVAKPVDAQRDPIDCRW